MIITVKVKPRSSEQKVIRFGDVRNSHNSRISDRPEVKKSNQRLLGNRFLIYLKEDAENNKANIELINLLSKYFGIPVGRIKIKHGASSPDKMIELS